MTLDAEAIFQQAIGALQRGQMREAEQAAQRLVTLAPNHADGWHMLGIAQWQNGAREAAIDAVRQAITLAPDRALYHQSIGNMFAGAAQYDLAARAFETAVAISPQMSDCWNNLGVALRLRGHPVEATGAFERALAVAPANFDARINLGMTLREMGRTNEAITCFREALNLRPGDATALGNLGAALLSAGAIEDAMLAFEQSLKANPDQPETLCNLGTARLALGDAKGARQDFERSLAMRPGFGGAARNILNAVLFDTDISQQERFQVQREAMRAVRSSGPETERHRPPRTGRRLRIGYLSSDFRGHPVARNFLPLFLAHNRSEFDIFCYADVMRPDDVTAKFAANATGFVNIAGLSDANVARCIMDDQIDILVFLAGRFDRNRPEIAWLRPAPVQVSFHDCATSGIDAMDFLIADRHLVPKTIAELFTERPLRLPTFYLHEPMDHAPLPGPLPVLRNGYITFSSFSNPAKLSLRTFGHWAAALNSVPGSRILLKYKRLYADQKLQRRIREAFARHGITEERLWFAAGDDDTQHHLMIYRDADIALDTFPFSGSTTSFEALWMGVPVVTLAGDTMVSRWTLAMLRTLGLADLAAETPEAFGHVAQNLATNLKRLEVLRATLRERMAASPLCRPEAKARQLERLFRAITKDH